MIVMIYERFYRHCLCCFFLSYFIKLFFYASVDTKRDEIYGYEDKVQLFCFYDFCGNFVIFKDKKYRCAGKEPPLIKPQLLQFERCSVVILK